MREKKARIQRRKNELCEKQVFNLCAYATCNGACGIKGVLRDANPSRRPRNGTLFQPSQVILEIAQFAGSRSLGSNILCNRTAGSGKEDSGFFQIPLLC